MMKLYRANTLIDGNGGEPVKNAALAVEDGKIVYAGPEAGFTPPEGCEAIAYGEAWLLPGLIDAHTHFLIDPLADFTGFAGRDSQTQIAWRGIKNLEKILKAGVTYIRDLGGYRHIEIELRKLLDAGEFIGPGVQVAGQFITMTGGHCWKLGREADGEAEVRKATREQLKAGADVIKVMASGGNLTPGSIPGAAQFSEAEMRAACEEAHKAGKRVTTHAHSSEAIMNALNGGVDCIEHGNYANEETLRMIKQKDVYYVPTIYGPWVCAMHGEERGLHPDIVRKCRIAMDSHRKSVEMAVRLGLKIGAGTDSGTPFSEHGTSLVEELRLLVEYGMTPMQAITAATRNGADLMGLLETHGTLEKDKAADFIVVEEDPLADITALRKLRAVYKGGVEVEI